MITISFNRVFFVSLASTHPLARPWEEHWNEITFCFKCAQHCSSALTGNKRRRNDAIICSAKL